MGHEQKSAKTFDSYLLVQVLQRRLVEDRRAIRCDSGASEENDTGKGRIRRTSPSSV